MGAGSTLSDSTTNQITAPIMHSTILAQVIRTEWKDIAKGDADCLKARK